MKSAWWGFVFGKGFLVKLIRAPDSEPIVFMPSALCVVLFLAGDCQTSMATLTFAWLTVMGRQCNGSP